jgi:hypothetical protein
VSNDRAGVAFSGANGEAALQLTNSNNILLSPATFGVITQTASSPRQMQFSLRYDFHAQPAAALKLRLIPSGVIRDF